MHNGASQPFPAIRWGLGCRQHGRKSMIRWCLSGGLERQRVRRGHKGMEGADKRGCAGGLQGSTQADEETKPVTCLLTISSAFPSCRQPSGCSIASVPGKLMCLLLSRRRIKRGVCPLLSGERCQGHPQQRCALCSIGQTDSWPPQARKAGRTSKPAGIITTRKKRMGERAVYLLLLLLFAP